jgi:hypothetical protein
VFETSITKRLSAGRGAKGKASEAPESDPLTPGTGGGAENPYHPLPCVSVEELFGPSGRERVRQVTTEWLHRYRLTVTEFMHNATELRKFEGAGSSYQHGVQRIAVALSSKSKVPVVQYIKAVNALSSAAMRQVIKDDRAGLFPELDESGVIQFAQDAFTQPNSTYLLNGVLSKFLTGAKSWAEKLARLMSLANAASGGSEDSRSLVTATADAILGEMLSDPKILLELMGAERRLGDVVQIILHLFAGQSCEIADVSTGVQDLANGIAAGLWPAARTAMTRFVLETLRGTASLGGKDIISEYEAFCAVVDTIKPLYGPSFAPEDYAEIFATRSRRFVTPEAMFQFTTLYETPGEKLARIMEIEGKIHGSANKRALAPFAETFISQRDFEETFMPEAKGVVRLQQLGKLQRDVRSSAFPEGSRNKIAGLLDVMASKSEAQMNLLANLEKRYRDDPAELAGMLMKLFEESAFTEGALSTKARRSLLSALGKPGFAARFSMDHGAKKQAALMELVVRLKNLGISPEESVRAMSPA